MFNKNRYNIYIIIKGDLNNEFILLLKYNSIDAIETSCGVLQCELYLYLKLWQDINFLSELKMNRKNLHSFLLTLFFLQQTAEKCLHAHTRSLY